MLDILRKSSNTIVAKALLGVVTASFVVWGVGDVIRNGFGGASYAIKVGDITYGPDQVRTEFDRTFRQIQERNPKLTRDELKDILLPGTEQKLAAEGALQMAARSMGVVASDDAVRSQIYANRAFYDSNGKFSRDVFLQVLDANQLTEAAYVSELRLDIVRNRLTEASVVSGAAPGVLVDTLFRYGGERRSAGILSVDASKMTITGTPDDKALQATYQAHIGGFTQPEYRTLTAVTITSAAIAKGLTISEKDITDAYNADPSVYAEPEKRDLLVVLVDNQATAKAIADAAKNADGLAAAAAAAKAQAPISLDGQSAAGLPGPIADAVFKLKAGEVVGPLQSALGWNVFAVRKITPSQTRPLSAVHDDVRQHIVQSRVGDALNEAETALQDSIGGGSSLEDAASKLNLPIVHISAVSANNTTPDGKPASGLPSGDLGTQILSTAYAQSQGEATRVVQSGDDAYFAVRVDKIIPSAPKPLDAVKNDVVTLWQMEQRKKAAEALAKDLSAKLAAAALPDTLAKSQPGLSWTVSPAVTRDGTTVQGAASQLPKEVVDALFTLPLKSPTVPGPQTQVVPVDTGADVVRVESVAQADPAQATGQAKDLADSLKSTMGQDLQAELTAAFAKRYPAQVNQAAINSAF